jgi:hypothetical protein
MFISILETCLIDYQRNYLYGEDKMFEEMATGAIEMLTVLFWVTLVFIVIWGALLMRNVKNLKCY